MLLLNLVLLNYYALNKTILLSILYMIYITEDYIIIILFVFIENYKAKEKRLPNKRKTDS